MNCEEIEEKLSEYIEGRLDPSNAKAVQDHVFSCPRCQAEAQVLAHTRRAVSQLPSVEPPPGFSQRVMARIREDEQRPSFWQDIFLPLRIKIPIHALAILLVGGLVFYLYQANKPVQTEVAKLAPPASLPLQQKDQVSSPPAFIPVDPVQPEPRPPDEVGLAGRVEVKREKKATAPAVKEEQKPSQPSETLVAKQAPQAEEPAQEPTIQTFTSSSPESQSTDFELTLVAHANIQGKETLLQQVEDLVKKVGGQSVQHQDVPAKSKQGLLGKAQGPTGQQIALWLVIPEDRYGQLKTELSALGSIQKEREPSPPPAAPSPPASFSPPHAPAPKAFSKASSKFRVLLILQLPEKP
jgi:hypothetical protein